MIRDNPLPEGSPLWESCLVVTRRDGMGLSSISSCVAWACRYSHTALCVFTADTEGSASGLWGESVRGSGAELLHGDLEGSSWKPVSRVMEQSAVCCVDGHHHHLMMQTPFLRKPRPREMERPAQGHMASEVQK